MAGLIINDPYGGGQESISSGRSQIPLRETYSVDPRAASAQYADKLRNTNQLVDALSTLSKTVGSIEEQNKKLEADNAEAYVADVAGKLNSTDPVDKQLAALRPDLNPWTRAAMSQIIARQNAQTVAQTAIENMPMEARQTPEATQAYFDDVVKKESARVAGQPFYSSPFIGALRDQFGKRSGQLSSERTTVMTEAMRQDGRTQQYNAMEGLIKNGQLPVDPSKAPNPEEASEVVAFAQKVGVSPLNVAMLLQTQQAQTTPDEFAGVPGAIPMKQRIATLERMLVANGIKPGATFAEMYKAVNPKGNAQEDAKVTFPKAAAFLGLPLDERSLTVGGKSNQTAVYGSPKVKAVLDFIAKPESGGNYNAYLGNASNQSVDLTDMTLTQVMDFQKEMVSGGKASGAVGRYQIINKTLRSLIDEMGLDPATTKFTPEMQDKMAITLLKRRGLDEWVAGNTSDASFADSLAKEWASLPVISGASAGKSYYEGVAGNKAGVSAQAVTSLLGSAKQLNDPNAKPPDPNDPNNAPLSPEAYQLRQVFFNVDGIQDKTHPLYSRTQRKQDAIANVKQIAMQSLNPDLLSAIPTSIMTPAEREDVSNWGLSIRKEIKSQQDAAWTQRSRAQELAKEQANQQVNEALIKLKNGEDLTSDQRAKLMLDLNAIDPGLADQFGEKYNKIKNGKMDPVMESAIYRDLEQQMYDTVAAGGDPTKVPLSRQTDPELAKKLGDTARALAKDGGELREQFYRSSYDKAMASIYGMVGEGASIRINNPGVYTYMMSSYNRFLVEEIGKFKAQTGASNITADDQRSVIFNNTLKRVLQAYPQEVGAGGNETIQRILNDGKTPPTAPKDDADKKRTEDAVKKFGFGQK